jgi:hypothetical protein
VGYPKYTQVAAKAVSLAELFEARFAAGFEGPARFRVELASPDGPSTAGGKQALQHIKLVPEGGGTTIVIGSASLARYAAEIRTFEHIAELHAQRFRGARIPLDVARYRELTQNLAAFFKAMKLEVTFSDLTGPPRSSSTMAPPPAAEQSWLILVAIALGVAIAVVAAYALFLRR